MSANMHGRCIRQYIRELFFILRAPGRKDLFKSFVISSLYICKLYLHLTVCDHGALDRAPYHAVRDFELIQPSGTDLSYDITGLRKEEFLRQHILIKRGADHIAEGHLGNSRCYSLFVECISGYDDSC